ncbi:zinc finger CCCH domain-containing protein 44 isoform X2 [Cajanus cajan]|uniref:zinc finger CCCH domain-containing protein 44 isoform X2 n=1 Tax=Cajanus cajan TaxID=3821 RepID=UPI00098DD611|nr:zinc finger CCCH domain-containing protein 44 isoform X2 [Cajanus cajan]
MEEPPQPQPQPPPPTAARDSRLLGVPVAQRDPEGDAACCAPKLEVAVVDAAVLKRKRGRPAKGAPKVAPPVRQKKDEEDVCFICFDGGSLVLCDRRGCPKAYHPSCIKRDEAFFRSKAKWNCGWHICSVCQKAAHYMCYTCTYSLCKGCIKDADFVCVRENKGMCGICMRTIMLIENSAQGNKEMCEVDFDDKSSWEYLFKVYWIYLKGKLSLTFDELLRAKNQWKGVAPMSCKQSPHELYHLRDDKGSGSENSCIDIESNNLKNKRPRRQPKLLSKGDCLDNWITSGGDSGVSLTDCTKWASKELLEFVAHMKNGDTSLLSQFDVQNLLLEYVKKNNLCDPQQNSQIVCDSRLLNLFGKACVGHMEIPKLLESHFLLRRNGPADNTFGVGIINAVANEGEGHDNYNKQLMLVNDKGCKKDDVLVPQNNPDAYAAIDAHNIKLIYLRRSLMENLTEDIEKIHEKIVGAFVRIRICGGDQKQDMYRLVQVVGTSKVAQPYKIGTRTTDIKLEILNLNRKEVIPIGEISNQEFSEDECKRLRESIKYGLSKRLTVGEILDKALTLQAIRVNDLLEAEILRLNHLRDRASENGHRKELKEYVEKLQLLNSPEERERRLQEIPDVHSDPNLDSMFESDEDDGESDERKQDSNILSKCLGLDRREGGSIFPRNSNSVFNDMGCKTQDLAPTHEPIGNICTPKNPINRDDTAIDDNTNAVVKSEVSSVALDISSSLLPTGMEQPFNNSLNDRSWHYQDPTGKIQGPFSMLQLYKWNTTGGFPPDLRIWRIDEKQDNSILLTDALSEKFSKHVSLALNSQLLSLGVSVTLDNKDNSQDAEKKGTKNETSTDGQIIEQRKEQKVDNTSTQSDGKDEPVRSNGWHGQLHGYPSLLSTAIPEKLNENSSDKLRKSHGIVGNSKDNGNNGSNRTSDGQSNSGQSYQKQSDSEENSGQSSGHTWRHPNVNSSSNCLVTTSAHVSGTKTPPHKLGFDLHNPPSPPACNTSSEQTWRHPNVDSSSNCLVTTSTHVSGTKTSPHKLGFDLDNPPSPPPCNTSSGPTWRHSDINSSSNCLVTTSAHVSGTKTSPHKLGFDLHNPPSPPACNTSTWQAIIGEPNDFDESVSDLLAEVEAMESLGGLESPTSIMKCNEDLTEGSKNDCLSFVAELSPMLDAGKGDALCSTGDLNLPSQPTAAEEPLRQADVHDHHHQRISMEHSSRSSKIEVGTKNVSVSCNQWDSSSENSPIVPPPATLGLAVDTTWRLGLENTHLGWSGIDQGNANVGWGVGQTAVQENRSSNSYTSVVTPGFGDSQTRYGNDRFSAPRDRGFQGHGRESGFGRSRMAYNRQPSYGVGNGGSYRPLPKGQRVCKFYEGGYCKKGSSCDYWHP